MTTASGTTPRGWPTRRHLLAGGLAAAALPAIRPARAADDLSVRVLNRSEPVLCAEKDNIELSFLSPQVRSFRIQAIHPAFIGMIVADRWAPDFTSCDMTSDPVFAANARRQTFAESPELWLTGYTYPSFWRPNTVPIRVGDRVETGFHVVQLWVRFRERAEEVLVVYPPDGYWRIRPLPPPHMRWSAYGSSFLVGPVEIQERPIVALREIVFDPQNRRFTLAFVQGGSATLTVSALDQDHLAVDVVLEKPVGGDLPFASLRSMYATEHNCDVARIAWRAKGAKGWGEAPVLDYKGGDAVELWAGRTVASRHNTSAPDMVFGKFAATP